MAYTEELVEVIIKFRGENIPADVVEQAKILILDALGCAIAGYSTTPGKQIVAQAKEFSVGVGEGTLIGDGNRVSAPFACWANSSLTNILDMDDVFAGTAHQANCLVPTAFGMGEAMGKSGYEVVESFILRFEVGSRIMMYCWPSASKGRIYFPSTWQVFDAVTVAAILLDLERSEFYNAFGLAGTVPPLPIDMVKFVERPMGFSKNVFGWTTFTGVFWTLMAQKGAEGTNQILDGDAGFWRSMGSDFYNYDELLEGFGEEYKIKETKFKPYPLCTWGHSSADAAKSIFLNNHIDPKTIQSITVRTLNRAVDFLSDCEIKTIYDAQFSLPHAMAMIALGKTPGPEWMSKENLFQNAEARAISEKVKMELDPSAEGVFNAEKGLAVPSEVEVIADGKLYRERVKYSKGTPNNPFTSEELKDKFQMLASSEFDEEKVQEIMEKVDRLDELKRISDLTHILGK